jgi:hypothetical protein
VAETPPQFLTLKRNRDLGGLERRPWTRTILLLLLTLVIVAGLLNVFGQRPSTETVTVPSATFEVYAPDTLRGGLIFMARFTIDAREDLDEATIVLDPGWLEGITLNTVEPSPVGEASRDGRLALDFGHVAAGSRLIAFLQFQVNPTEVGRQPADVDLYDGETLLAHVDRRVTVWP